MFNNLTTKAYVSITEAFHSFKNDQRGVTAIEYGLIAIFIAAFIIYVFNTDGGFIDNMVSKFSSLSSKIASASASRWGGN
ncbi:Flp pilus assembly protein, pilin Flp [Phocoenobacter uteri]|uniref:Flp pilus assembly protein, pilin Flp n=1 Tax=Phocoenobacter uteri TaxID=146806 RepID=A0A379C9F9_9PAST|nr:Flp family type IVb pilin [Phocoenobacter uteri]MDG6882644.1 fimbrial protein [Phocoenobacter uteri]SUB58809.1 Flp pilus assembly protein, pilin Flp [Phocoenobacter uteri]